MLKEKLKILVLSDSFAPYQAGGAPIVAYRLASELKSQGHEVLVFSTCQKKNQAGEQEVNGLKVFFLYHEYNLKWRGFVALKNKKVLSVLEEKIKQFKPDIVHAHNVHNYISYASLRLAKKYVDKVFMTAHDVASFHQDKFASYINQDDLNCPKEFDYRLTWLERLRQFKITLNPFRNLMVRHYLKYTNKIFAVSGALKEAMRQNGITNVEVIYNAVSLSDRGLDHSQSLLNKKFGLQSDQKIVFMANRFGSLKGGNMILPYIEEMKKKMKDFVFVIAGEKNNFTNRISKSAKAKGLANYLVFTGWLEEHDLNLLYAHCDVCLIPSLCLDTFNNNNIEAMRFKKPVVGTCFGGTPEVVVDGQTGFIVNPLNVKDTADKVVQLLTDDELAKKFGQAGLERVRENFLLSGQAEKYLKYFV